MKRENICWKAIIKAGNKVKIRQWDDMKREFGVYHERGGSDYPFHFIQIIDCFKKFPEYMKKYCGETIKISEDMEKDFNEYGFFYYEDYVFSTDMLEPYEEELDVINIPVKDEYLKDLHEEKHGINEEFEYKEETEENNLYEQLKGKYIKIKSLEEIKEKALGIDKYNEGVKSPEI